jgi:hypothetical protein
LCGDGDAGGAAWLAADVASSERVWGFDDEARRFLLEVTADVPSLRAVVSRAEAAPQFPGLWVVRASARELDEMFSFAEGLMDRTRGRRRIELLGGMLASLCTSIDGF